MRACHDSIHRWVVCCVVALTLLMVHSESGAQSRTRKTPNAEAIPAGGVRLYTSPNFRLVTDLSEEDAEALLVRLETMIKLVSGYWGRRLTKTIDMYVAEDISKWPADVLAQMSPRGISQIEGRAGVTEAVVQSIGGRPVNSEAVVYAVADHGTPQHEAVHAYCSLTFGETGPVWYSEGMAEVGQYWKEGDKSVSAPDIVIEYLTQSEPKSLNDIVNNPLETTGDSWQNYAWRWALCHLLGFNENYTDRFKPLGLALLGGGNIDFWQVYGAQATEIEFEYKFFLEHLEPGYRVDLCSWDWKSKFIAPRSSGTAIKLRADRGWQASKVRVEAGQAYSFECAGEWTLGGEEGNDADDSAAARRDDAASEPVTADGDASGKGRVVACIFKDYELTEEFDWGASGTWTAPQDGWLFLRCRDDWGRLADNKGAVTCKIKLVK
ncbi:MAG: hypothetical protein R3B90_02380 [Planctomycetaceae bacterium]